jgi:hypothetical protein
VSRKLRACCPYTEVSLSCDVSLRVHKLHVHFLSVFCFTVMLILSLFIVVPDFLFCRSTVVPSYPLIQYQRPEILKLKK